MAAETTTRIAHVKELIRSLETDLEKAKKAGKYGIRQLKADLADQAKWIKEQKAAIRRQGKNSPDVTLQTRLARVETVARPAWQAELKELVALKAALPRIKSDLRDKRSFLKELEKRHKAELKAAGKGPKPAKAPKLTPGYAYEFHASEDAHHWHSAPDDNWETVMVSASDAKGARYRGRRAVDGVIVAVFRGQDGVLYAQKG